MAAMVLKTALVWAVLNCLFVLFAEADDDCRVEVTVTGSQTISCRTNLVGLSVSLEIKFKFCRKNPTLSAKVDVDKLNIHLKKDNIEPSVEIPISKFGSIGFEMENPNPNKVNLKVFFNPLGLMKIPIYSDSIDPDCNPIIFWFNSQNIGVLIAIGAGALLFLIGCCYCCTCCCCRCCRKQQPPPVTVIVAGEHDIPPSDSNMPYMKMENI